MKNLFPFSDTNRRFYTLDYFYRKNFGEKCFKVPLDGGFTCPNLNGAKGFGGCTYCGLKNHERNIKPLREQFENNRKNLHRKWKDALYIAYFNDFTNTYAPVGKLRSLYEEAISFDGVIGLNIATRADTLPDIIVSQLELLPPDTVIARISGDGKANELIAPLWCRDKFMVMNKIDKEFVRRNSWQGKFYCN